jgi:hypothetical protein
MTPDPSQSSSPAVAVTCLRCGLILRWRRRDTRYCSVRCRVAALRARQSKKETASIEALTQEGA